MFTRTRTYKHVALDGAKTTAHQAAKPHLYAVFDCLINAARSSNFTHA